ncbi:YciI family protein [Lutimonas sp.]|uniref:YciI family protein n=1 Tax=Lutimonas sp. TaxID=1872403 RepID=UPI003D9B9DE1
MKNTYRVFSVMLFALLLWNCQKETKEKTEGTNPDQNHTEINSKFDSVKAAAYGADAYGMKKYVIAFLKRGPNKSVDSLEKSKLQRAHMENINRLAEEGKLVLAGPFFGDGDLRGIYVFNVDNLEDAEALTNSDPSIQAGVLSMELKEWYGSAALMAINDLHYSISKNDIVE